MRYPDSVEYLYALGNEMKSAKLGLDRILALLERLGHPQKRFRVIHVAGTNGKGSTCAMIASGLRAAGLRTGLYTSPHLLQPTERIRIDGAALSKDDFLRHFLQVHEAAESMVSHGELDAHPSYFETLTAMAFCAFAGAAVEIAVVEVGLGGRLDATNVVQPELSVITPIDFDHEAWLGHSLEGIAGEKAGIIKPGAPVLCASQHPTVWPVLESKAASLGVPFHRSSAWTRENLEIHEDGCRFVLRRPVGSGDSRPPTITVDCPLRGAYQAENAVTAAAALDLLGIDAAAIADGLHAVRWPGRLQRVGEHPDIYLDGAHNPAGCAALAAFIQKVRNGRKVWLVFGLMRDKAISEMAELLFPLADHLVLTAPDQPRALRPEALAEHAEGMPGQIAHTVSEALHVVSQAPAEDVVFIAGSLYLVAEALAVFQPSVSAGSVDIAIP